MTLGELSDLISPPQPPSTSYQYGWVNPLTDPQFQERLRIVEALLGILKYVNND